MSDKLTQTQNTSTELSDQDLDAVSGGTGFGALSIADAAGVAFGDSFAITTNKTATQAISVGPQNLALGVSSSASIAG